MFDIILVGLSIVASVAFVILFALLGWFIVWTLILSRFKFIRELLRSSAPENSAITELKTSRSKVKKTRKD